jgi:hypothetical protein
VARCESENAAVRDEFNAKLSSEISVVSDKIDDVSREPENKIATLTSNTKSVRECKTLNAHVVQTRKKTHRQGQEITAASSSLVVIIIIIIIFSGCAAQRGLWPPRSRGFLTLSLLMLHICGVSKVRRQSNNV